MKRGHWSFNAYHRLNVKDYVEGFCGWKALKELVNHGSDLRNQNFLNALFLTGGRVSEVLPLTKQNFEVRQPQGIIIVRGMKLLKRYKKLSESVDEEGRRRWTTRTVKKSRKPFPILIREPLTTQLLEWLQQNEGLLFPSPYKHKQPLSRSWAYKFVRRLDKDIPEDLHERLGLNQPFIIEGKKVSDRLHLWLHWFRSERASQLVSDYGYEVIDLVDFFSWEKPETALRYAKKGWRGLAAKMQSTQISYA